MIMYMPVTTPSRTPPQWGRCAEKIHALPENRAMRGPCNYSMVKKLTPWNINELKTVVSAEKYLLFMSMMY